MFTKWWTNMNERKFVCRCFFTHNIFLDDYKAHVIFEDEEQFCQQYKQVLRRRGCITDDQWQSLLLKIKSEVERRKALGDESKQRKETISFDYRPKHPGIYYLKESYFDEKFLEIVQYCKSEEANAKDLLSNLQICKGDQIFRFPVFTKEFCNDFLDEIAHFEASDCPRGRPNTMNNYGILLDELGFDQNFMTPFRQSYLTPIAALLYPQWGGDSLDSHKAFTVHYKTGQDIDLSYHYDNAEVTLNVCLGKGFAGGELYFGDMRQVSMQETECVEVGNIPEYGILHRGQHMHGALSISDGERCNLIIWMRSSKIRNKLCPMCNRKPSLVETYGNGDGFTVDGNMVAVCTAL